jgi:hypothetical protein
MHFAQTDGPRGFLWKYALTYLAATVLMAGIAYLLFQPVAGALFDAMVKAAQGAGDSEIEATLTRELTSLAGRIVMSYISLLILGALFWAVFEASIQRRYVREEGFRIGLGGDELRLLVVGLLWVMFMIASFILTMILTAVLAGFLTISTDQPVVLGVGVPAIALLPAMAWVYFAVRLAPASAMTIRDRKIHFLGAWGATKRRAIPLFFSYLVLSIVFWVVFIIAYMAGAAAMVGTFFAMAGDPQALENDPVRLIGYIMQGRFLFPLIGFYAVMLLMQGLFFYVWSGPAALAAKTDPRGGGITQAPDVFA